MATTDPDREPVEPERTPGDAGQEPTAHQRRHHHGGADPFEPHERQALADAARAVREEEEGRARTTEDEEEDEEGTG